MIISCTYQLLTENRSCNPSFGGVGKGILVREIDALDGLCARACDQAGISFKMLNISKGPAVWGPRAQIDRQIYKKCVLELLKSCKNLKIVEDSVEQVVIDQNKIRGCILSMNRNY